jgi:hypothetical protein
MVQMMYEHMNKWIKKVVGYKKEKKDNLCIICLSELIKPWPADGRLEASSILAPWIISVSLHGGGDYILKGDREEDHWE